MKRALLHSGGNARGAVAVRTLDLLDPADYDACAFVSVGAVNTPEWAAGRMAELDAMYREVSGLSWYLRMRSPFEWYRRSGLYSIDRLRAKIAERGAPRSAMPAMPMFSGVYDYQADRYRSVDLHGTADTGEWLDTRIASMAIPIVMAGVSLPVNGEQRVHYDGGMRAVIPHLPDWRSYDEIHAILCSPIQRSNALAARKVDGWVETVSRSVDIWIDGVVQRDIERLRMYARAGKRVVLYAPRDSGPSFDASPEMMAQRLDVEGAWMAANPTVLTGT